MNRGEPAWYAIRTRSKQEFIVREQLNEREVENFLPTVDRWRKWSDRRKLVTSPLFPGYAFARFALSERLNVLTIREVVNILGISGMSVSIPDEEIEGIKRLVASPLPHKPHHEPNPDFQKGMPVEVIHGPLTGLRGLMIRHGNHARFVVSIDLIGQGASVEIDASALMPIRGKVRAS